MTTPKDRHIMQIVAIKSYHCVVFSLHSFQSVCKLYGGASAAVMCVAVNNPRDQPDVDQVFAGSKDHYVKVNKSHQTITF